MRKRSVGINVRVSVTEKKKVTMLARKCGLSLQRVDSVARIERFLLVHNIISCFFQDNQDAGDGINGFVI